jgi:hypothetical protein
MVSTCAPWTVTFWFDPACPLSRITARWVELVAHHRPVRIDWRVMSLSILNEGLEIDPEGDTEGYLWIPARMAAAVRDRYGSDRLAAFAAALWTDEDGRPRGEMGDLGEALDRAALPGGLDQLGWSTEVDPVLRTSHDAAVALVTGSVGTPDRRSRRPDGRPPGVLRAGHHPSSPTSGSRCGCGTACCWSPQCPGSSSSRPDRPQ